MGEQMIPQFPQFRPIDIKDYNLILSYLNASDRKICELAIANIYIWKDFDRAETTLINNNVCIRINPLDSPPYFLEPLSLNNIEGTIRECLAHAKKISRVSEEFINKIDNKNYQIACQRSQFDYVYKVKDLADLKGKDFDGKRNHIRRFTKQFPNYKFTDLKLSCGDKIFGLFDKWFEIRKDSRYFPRLAYTAQKNALGNACKYFKELNLLGAAIMDGERLLGFMIGSRLNNSTISAHFQYCDPEIQGLTQTIMWESCNKLFNGFEYINMEQDLGIPGLRTAKLSYHPFRIEKKYEIKLKVKQTTDQACIER